MERGRDGLHGIIGQVFGVESVTEESSPETIPAWDSVNHLNLVLALESEYAVEISVEEALAMRDVAAVRDVLRKRGAPV
jgi:acyl carrier protein